MKILQQQMNCDQKSGQSWTRTDYIMKGNHECTFSKDKTAKHTNKDATLTKPPHNNWTWAKISSDRNSLTSRVNPIRF